MSLFESAGLESDAPRPLADRLRPQALGEVVGQDHILGAEAPLAFLNLGGVGNLTWIDPRPDQFPNPVRTGVEVRPAADPAALVAAMPKGAAALVMTHSHDLDFAVIEAVLRRGDASFCGLIGSDTKRARFVRRLRDTGVAADGLTCPIGIAGIGGKEPRTIAIAVAAQLLGCWERAAIPGAVAAVGVA